MEYGCIDGVLILAGNVIRRASMFQHVHSWLRAEKVNGPEDSGGD
jgi:hypothetical protein